MSKHELSRAYGGFHQHENNVKTVKPGEIEIKGTNRKDENIVQEFVIKLALELEMYKTKEEEPEEQAIVELEEVTEVKVATISKPDEDVVDNIQWLLSQIQGDEEDEDELIMTKLKKAIDKTPTPLLRFISECANSKQETPPWGDVSEEDRTTLTELDNEDYEQARKDNRRRNQNK